MRRLWSHIAIAATSLLMVGATFATVVTNMNSNIEFEKGREFTFRVMAKDDDGNPDRDYEFTTNDAVEKTAKIMEKRLATANISRYKVETQGYDTIKVSFAQDTEQQYEIIKNYLSFNATLAISNSKETYALATEFLDSSKQAYLETSDEGYPAIIIPIKSDNELFQAVYTEAKEMSDNNTGEVEEEHDHEDGEEEEEAKRHAYLYLWYDYVQDYYSYDKINQKSTDTYDATIANKVLMTFDAANPFQDSEKQDALRAYVHPNSGEDATVTPEGLRQAYENGRYYVNLLNAGEMEYHVDFMSSKRASYFVENLVSLDTHETVRWGMTFVGTVAAILVVTLILFYFYRLGSSSVAVTSILSAFFGLLFVTVLGAEFNIAGMIGVIALGVTSVVSGIVYLNKFKEECYRGRTLKKANTEAAKKALLPIVDMHVVLIAMGVACYLLGGAIMKSFAVATVLGGIVSMLLNLVYLRGMMWLVTNEQGLAGRYDLFDVTEDQVANGLDDNKVKYEGEYAGKDFTKGKKAIGIAALVLLVGSIAALITFGVKDKGAVYGSTTTENNSQLYIEYSTETADNTALTAEVKNKIDTILENGRIEGALLKDAVEVENYDYVTKYDSTKSGSRTVYYAYYRLTFDKALTGDEIIKYNDKEVAAKTFFTEEGLSDVSITLPDNVTISLKDSVRINADQPAFGPIALATTVGIAIAAFYLLLRYRLSRGLANLIVSFVATGITAGFFAMLHFVPATSYVSLATPFVAIFTLMIGIIFMNKERDMVLEDRSRDNSYEGRNALMVKATALSVTPIIAAFLVALAVGIDFCIAFMLSGNFIFLNIIAGLVIATIIVIVCFGPCAQFFYKLFSGIKFIKPKAKKKKARPVRVNKSAEPEEAIFIGIND